mmetsp:Transcript_30561/g.62185  ORF Transcript_30561/g.62185 Transcript_30561/m.62185 type:complete len:154 (+) Transcript_30561:1-462(+)
MVSNKKKDLEEMLDNLNVQVENPVCVMDQENSKGFITGNEKEKYHFFALATDLDRNATKIQSTQKELNLMITQSHDFQYRLKSFAIEAENAEEDFKKLQRMFRIETDVSRMRCLLFWHEVESKQKELELNEEKQEGALAKRSGVRDNVGQGPG